MKVTINIECTALEARLFLGLPDVQPMQVAILAEMEKRLLAETAKFSPEGVMQAWFTGGAQGADWFRNVMGGLFVKANADDGNVINPSAPQKK